MIAGVLLFGAGLFLIGDRRMLFNRTFNVTAEFANIAGLEEGAKVRVAGLDAGAVDTIHVPANPSARFRVELRIRQDLHPLIRVDSVATIQTDGLVGNKFVQVDAGTDQAATVPPGGTIRSREAFELSAMLQRMSDTVDLVNTTITDLKGGVEAALASISDTAKEAQDLMNDVGGDARAIMSSSQRVSENLSAIVSDVRQGKGTVGKLVTDDSLYTSAKSIAADAQKAVATLRDATEQARQAVVDFRGGNGPLKGMTGDLQQTLTAAKDAMDRIDDGRLADRPLDGAGDRYLHRCDGPSPHGTRDVVVGREASVPLNPSSLITYPRIASPRVANHESSNREPRAATRIRAASRGSRGDARRCGGRE